MFTDRWCFTVNNPREWRPTWIETQMAYLVWEVETAPTTNTIHVQGYVRFKARKRLDSARRLLHPQVHLEQAKGTEEQNRTYCLKDGGEHQEHGEFLPDAGRQGRRSDLKAATDMIAAGADMTLIAKTHPETFVRYSTGLRQLHLLLRPQVPTVREIAVTILFGPTNVGKSHRFWNRYPGGYMIKDSKHPWDGYIDQQTIFFEEFNDNDWKITDMNTYCDKWPLTLPARYYNKEAAWNNVVISTNIHPYSWWPNEPQPLREAYWRRITQICEINNKDEIFTFYSVVIIVDSCSKSFLSLHKTFILKRTSTIILSVATDSVAMPA